MNGAERAKLRQFGRRVRDRRKEIGLSQVALGAAIGVRQQTIGKYESGDARMPWPKVEALVAALAGDDHEKAAWLLGMPAPDPGRRYAMNRQAVAAAIGRLADGGAPPAGAGRTETFLRLMRGWPNASGD